MNSGFKSGVIIGSIMGISMGAYFVNKMGPLQKMKAKRNTKKAISNIKNGMSNLW